MPDLPLPEIDGTSLVLVGAFNPRIFHPAWFVRNQLLPEGVETTAEVEIVNNDLCAFSTDWFRLEVLSDRLILSSVTAPAVGGLRDLLLGTLRVLSHTPVQKVGLNTHAHYKLPSAAAWNAFGHSLAPKDALWAPLLEQPGTLSLSIQGVRPDDYEGHVRVKVEPSTQVENGIFIDTNDEFSHLEADSAVWVEEVLDAQWDPSRARAERIRSHLLDQVSP